MSSQKVVSAYGSKEWANEQLRFAIKVLKGKCGGHRWKGNLAVALMVRDRLWANGYTWQAARVDNWVHRLQPRKADSLKGEREREVSVSEKGGGGHGFADVGASERLTGTDSQLSSAAQHLRERARRGFPL